MCRLSPQLTLFPYTTLFRSHEDQAADEQDPLGPPGDGLAEPAQRVVPFRVCRFRVCRFHVCPFHQRPSPSSQEARSQEHTSELQSQSNIVCRLLLEKKNRIF